MSTVLASQTRTRRVPKTAPINAAEAQRIAAIDAEKAAEKGDRAVTSLKGVKTMTDADKRAKVTALIDELRSATEVDDKKRIRRSLRALGHRGGLRVIDNPAPAVAPAPTATKGKRAAKKA